MNAPDANTALRRTCPMKRAQIWIQTGKVSKEAKRRSMNTLVTSGINALYNQKFAHRVESKEEVQYAVNLFGELQTTILGRRSRQPGYEGFSILSGIEEQECKS